MALSESKTRVAYDLGRHASDEMMETVVRICGTAGVDATSVAATLMAFAFTLYRIRATARAMDKVLPNFSTTLEEATAILEKDEGPTFDKFAEAERKRRGL